MATPTDLLAIAGVASGGLSLAISAINSRRDQLQNMRPKLNVELISELAEDTIECHLEIQNVGQNELKIRSFRLYISDTGFNEDFIMGLANYNTNFFLYEHKILNKMFGIERELNYDNFVKSIIEVLSYERLKVTSVVTPEAFRELLGYYEGLEPFNRTYAPFIPSIFVRPAFLFRDNVKFFSQLKKMPENTFPQSTDIILFDPEAFHSKAKKDVYALSDAVYRLIWERNPAWTIHNAKDLRNYELTHPIHKNPMFEIREDQAILSVSPSELGIPETLSPLEKRSVNLQVSAKNKSKFEVKINLWVTSNRAKYLIFQEEVTNNYHFAATPRNWINPIKI